MAAPWAARSVQSDRGRSEKRMSMATTSSSTPAMDVFWDNVKTILYALALAMLRFTIAQPFRIPWVQCSRRWPSVTTSS